MDYGGLELTNIVANGENRRHTEARYYYVKLGLPALIQGATSPVMGNSRAVYGG